MELYKEMKKSFSVIEKLIGQQNINEFIHCEYNHLDIYHFGLGTWIRNTLLTDKSDLYGLFIKNGILYKDEMSMRVIQQFHMHLQRKYK